MSGAIGPGDFVEALRDQEGEPSWGFAPVSAGSIYTCSEVGDVGPIPPGWVELPCPDCGDNSSGLRLTIDHLTPSGHLLWRCLCLFRPMRRPPRAELIESLKAPPLEAPPAPTAPRVREDA